MEEKLNALCVRTVDYKDNDRLITLCTAEKGKILVKAVGCKSPKAKLKYAASPLCFGEYLLFERNGRYTLKGCEAFDTFSCLATDIKKYYGAFAVLEFTERLAENDATTCRNMLVAAVEALKGLAYGDKEAEAVLLGYLNSILTILGYRLNFDTCAVSGRPLSGKRICYDFYVGGLVLFENRSMDYTELSPDDILTLKGEVAEISSCAHLIEFLENVLIFSTGLKKSYSLAEFLKY